MTQPPADIPPEDKDWTGVLVDGCAECGFTPAYDVATTGERLRATIPTWQARLTAPDATTRPRPQTWSPVEYACHVRDVCELFRMRLGLMLAEDGARFANWDQDQTAVEQRYWEQDPATVARQYADQATATAAAFDAVAGGLLPPRRGAPRLGCHSGRPSRGLMASRTRTSPGPQSSVCRSASQAAAEASDGIRQSPRGDNEPPATTLGPLGIADRLNWLAKNRR